MQHRAKISFSMKVCSVLNIFLAGGKSPDLGNSNNACQEENLQDVFKSNDEANRKNGVITFVLRILMVNIE